MPEPETSAIGTTKVVHSNYRVYYASKIDAVAALETGGYVFAMLNNIYLCDAYGVVVDRRIQGRTTNLCSVPGPLGRFISAGAFLRAWSTKNGTFHLDIELVSDQPLQQQILSLCLVPRDSESTFCACGDDSGRIVFWEFNRDTAKKVKILPFAHDNAVNTLACIASRDGHHNFLISGSNDANIKIWNSKTYEYLRKIPYESSEIITLCPLSTGNFAAGTYQGFVTIYDPEDAKKVAEHKAECPVSVISEILPNVIAFPSSSQSIAIWDMRLPRPREIIESKKFQKITGIAKLTNQNIVLTDNGGKITLVAFWLKKWLMYRWLFLGQIDENSALADLPAEIIYHIIHVTYRNPKLHGFGNK